MTQQRHLAVEYIFYLSGSNSVRLIGDYSYLSINCLVLKAASSSWNDFYWKLREPEQWKTEDFWEKAIHGNRENFVKMKLWKKMEIWNVWYFLI